MGEQVGVSAGRSRDTGRAGKPVEVPLLVLQKWGRYAEFPTIENQTYLLLTFTHKYFNMYYIYVFYMYFIYVIYVIIYHLSSCQIVDRVKGNA